MHHATRFLLPALALVTFAVAVPRVALACWDGYRIEHEQWSVRGWDDVWDAERPRDWAMWSARIERLLPADATVTIDGSEVMIDAADFDWEGTFDDDWAQLFRDVAEARGASDDTIERALAVETHAYTVQVLAGANTARAEAVAQSIQALTLDSVDPLALYEAGGFPANNPVAQVVARENPDGEMVSAVIVGVFATRDDALNVREHLRDAHGIDGFVRYL